MKAIARVRFFIVALPFDRTNITRGTGRSRAKGTVIVVDLLKLRNDSGPQRGRPFASVSASEQAFVGGSLKRFSVVIIPIVMVVMTSIAISVAISVTDPVTAWRGSIRRVAVAITTAIT